MSENKKWQLELSEYIRQEEPEKKEKSEAWQTAIGLQAGGWSGCQRSRHCFGKNNGIAW